jgi:hypothetical protein
MALLDEKNLAGEAGAVPGASRGDEAERGGGAGVEVLATKRSQTQAELIRGLILREIEQSKTRHRASAGH